MYVSSFCFKTSLPSLATHQHYCFPTQPPGRDPTSSLKASTVLTKLQVVTWISSSPPLRIFKNRPSFYLPLKIHNMPFLILPRKLKDFLQALFLKSRHKRNQLSQGVFQNKILSLPSSLRREFVTPQALLPPGLLISLSCESCWTLLAQLLSSLDL